MIIAIDGPSGAGKSTVAKLVASKLGITYLDTGAMYRAAAVLTRDAGIRFSDTEKVAENLEKAKIDIVFDNGIQSVILNGRDVSREIRMHEISGLASDISRIGRVREILVAMQRRIAGGKSVVMDGRDIASCVFPNAEVKVYLTASSEVRAKRRYEELLAKGQSADYERILSDIETRDYNDMHRAASPLQCVPDAVFMDCSDMTAEQVALAIIELAIGAGLKES